MPRFISRYGFCSAIQVTLLISAIAICRISSAASFTGGNSIALRTSAASGLPSTAATAVYLDEFTMAGTVVQTLPVSGGVRKHACQCARAAEAGTGIFPANPMAALLPWLLCNSAHADSIIWPGGVHASRDLGSRRKTHKRRGGDSRGLCMLQRTGRDCECGDERQHCSRCSNTQSRRSHHHSASRWDGRSNLLCDRSRWWPLLHWRQRSVGPRALF